MDQLKADGWKDEPPSNATDGYKCEVIDVYGGRVRAEKYGEHGNSWHEESNCTRLKVILWRDYSS